VATVVVSEDEQQVVSFTVKTSPTLFSMRSIISPEFAHFIKYLLVDGL